MKPTIPCSPRRRSKCCTSPVHGTLKSHPKKKPTLHVGYIEHVLCRAPLILCFLDWNPTNFIPHFFPMKNRTHNPVQATEAWFMRPKGCCGALREESRGVWVWLEDAAKERLARIEEGRRKAAATKKARKTWVNKLIPHKSTSKHEFFPLRVLEFHNET